MKKINVFKFKTFKVDGSRTILVDFIDHSVQVLVGQFVVEGGQNVTQDGGGDVTVACRMQNWVICISIWSIEPGFSRRLNHQANANGSNYSFKDAWLGSEIPLKFSRLIN